MKQIRINFSGMAGHFDPENNFITNTLKKRYEVVISSDPDYLFYSETSRDYLDYDCVRIFYTGENVVPDFNICDYAIGFQRLEFGDRYIRYPIYLVDSYSAYSGDNYGTDVERAGHKHEANWDKREFCAFVYSNGDAAPCRQKIFEALSKYKAVHSGGRYLNNIGGPVADKTAFQSKYKFVIAFENSSSPGYTTEKIIGAFAAGSIPIYWGDPDICMDFNRGSFIDCNELGIDRLGDEETIKRVVQRVAKIDSDDALYQEMLHTPAFVDGDFPQKKRLEFENFLFHIVEQGREKAYRRNRYYWGERYERKQKIGNAFYWKCRKVIPIRDGIRRIKNAICSIFRRTR